MMPAADIVRAMFDYDASEGRLVWKRRTGQGARNDRVGMHAGSPHKDGYSAVQIGRKKYLEHRIIWLHVTGQQPPEYLDHKDGNRADSRVENLRPASKRLNAENQRLRNGKLGVDFHKASRKWRARITVEGVCTTLGAFTTQAEAQVAYLDAKRKYHEGCTI